MKRRTATLTAIACLMLLGCAAEAQAGVRGVRTPGVRRQQAAEQHRIRQGVRSGALTAREARLLTREQVRIERHECRAKADGVVTRRERARLHAELNAASRHIYRLKHNPRHR
jgi:hypothetical protein